MAAYGDAAPGDEIVLGSGRYMLTHRLNTTVDGTEAMPITVRGDGATVVFSDATGIVEGFFVSHPYWRFEDLRVEGSCGNDSRCEHAWHIVGAADFTIVRGNVARNFNAHIKANRSEVGGESLFPDDVLVEGNEFFSEAVRMTANPVTPIDVVGGRRWILRANYIHDFAKGMGNNISYAAFLKGNSRDGVIERNLVSCERLHTGQIRLGLSFGGGGSNPDPICEDRDCSVEHQGGVMRNNVIANCPADVGVFINECADCAILHNTIYNSTGIDVRFVPTSNIRVEGNILAGRIRDRDGATSMRANNLEMVTDWNAWFADPANLDFSLEDGSAFVNMGAASSDVPDDYCGNLRDDRMPDLGAVEYDGDGPCDTTTTHTGVMMPPVPDAGVDAGGIDAGAVDAGDETDAGSGTRDTGTAGDGGRSDAGERSGGGGCAVASFSSFSSFSWVALFVLLRRRRALL